MNVEAGAHPKSRDQIVIRRGTSQSGAGGISLADAFFVVERVGTELYIDRINEPSSGTGSGTVAAAVVLMAPSLTPAPGDLIYLMLYMPGAPAVLAVDSGNAYDCPENWWMTESFVNSDLWVADPNQHVLIMFPDELMPTAYALVRNTDFEQVEVLGGQVVSVGCGGAGFGTPALWVGANEGAGLGGFIDPLVPATSFIPHSVTDAEVRVSQYWDFTGTLSYAESGISVDTAKSAFAAIDAFDLTGTPGPPGASAYEVAVAEGFVGDEAAWLASLDGPQGDPALWNFTGAYSSGASYAIGDIATYLGQTWYRLDAHGGNTGDTPVEGTYWTLIAAEGATGPPGTVQSVTGTAPIAITGTATDPNVTLGSLDASQTTTGVFSTARLGTGTASSDTFLRGDSTWSEDMPLQISVKNTSGGALTKGTPVYATGTVGATAVVEVAGADASVSAKMPAIGLLMQDLAINGTGLVMIMGTITGLATTGYNINSGMFVAAGGGLTNTRPTAATDLVQNVARVTRVHATTGSVMVLGPGRTNDVPNLIATNFLATSGTASATTFLRGDQSWSTAITSVTGTAPIVSSGSSTAPAISVTTGFVASTVAAGDDTRITAFPLLVTGQYTSTSSITTASTTLTSNRLYYLPFLITVSTTFDRIAINHVATVGGAGSVARLGIYNSTSGLPSTRVLDAGTIDLSTGAALKYVSISQTLTPGLYWLAAVPQITSGSPTFTVAPPSIPVPSDTSTSAGTKYEGSVTGTLPASATPLASNVTQPPVLYLRKS